MEFYEFFEKICSYIPEGYEGLRNAAEAILPWLFGIMTGATCFFGHFMHKVWNKFFFWGIGFIVPLLILFAVFKPTGIVFWVLVITCIGTGVLCAWKSGNLFKAKIFVTTFLMTFIAVSGYVDRLGSAAAILLGLIFAAAAAILGIKYKYITVIATTAFSGSMMFWGIFENTLGMNHTLRMVLAIILGIIGLAVQCYVERKELKESYEEIKEKGKKAKHAYEKVKDKVTDK